jgi:hypothetical protein
MGLAARANGPEETTARRTGRQQALIPFLGCREYAAREPQGNRMKEFVDSGGFIGSRRRRSVG